MPEQASRKPCIYYVDDKPQQTFKEELTVQRILEKVGIRIHAQEQVDALLWELRGKRPVEHKDPEERIRMQEDMRFRTRLDGGSHRGTSQLTDPEQGTASGSPAARTPLSPQSGSEDSMEHGPPAGPPGPPGGGRSDGPRPSSAPSNDPAGA